MSYPGSKGQAGTWQRIIGQMPPHSVYVEPFFGSGQVFWRKRRVMHELAEAIAQRHGRRSGPLEDIATTPLALAAVNAVNGATRG